MEILGPKTLEETLPRLNNIYHSGKLVPFLGSGMSAPEIPTWNKFIKELASDTDTLKKINADSTSEDLVRYADQVVTYWRRQGEDILTTKIMKSLGYTNQKSPDPTPQTKTLSEIYWPLVITTNYDKMFIESCISNQKRPDEVNAISVFGRSRQDCHSLLSTLRGPGSTAYWALQGYLGENINGKRLLSEIVLGYHDYRRVTHNNPIFRSTFSEIFRNYSFLFLGAGLTEHYFRGLFGEVLETLGDSPHPHFALINTKEIIDGRVDCDFLLTKLNIRTITYDDEGNDEPYKGFPRAIESLKDTFLSFSPKVYSFSIGQRNLGKLSKDDADPILEIIFSSLPKPYDQECSVVSAGYAHSKPALKLSRTGKYLFNSVGIELTEKDFKELSDQNEKYIWVHRRHNNIYAAVARQLDNSKFGIDSRDLRLVCTATFNLLKAASKKNFNVVNTMLLAGGRHRTFPPIFSLIQMIRGLKHYISTVEKQALRLRIFVVDPSVTAFVRQNLPVIEELLSCEDIRVYIRIDMGMGSDKFQVFINPESKFNEISEYFQICKGWEVQILPEPYKSQSIPYDSKEQIIDLGIVPGSTIRFFRRSN